MLLLPFVKRLFRCIGTRVFRCVLSDDTFDIRRS